MLRGLAGQAATDIIVAGAGGGGVTGGTGGVAEVKGGTGGIGSTTNGIGGPAFVAGGNAPASGNGNGGEADIFGGSHHGSGSDGIVRIQQDFNGVIYGGPIFTNIGSSPGVPCPANTFTLIRADGGSGGLSGGACEPAGGYTGSGGSAIPACVELEPIPSTFTLAMARRSAVEGAIPGGGRFNIPQRSLYQHGRMGIFLMPITCGIIHPTGSCCSRIS